MQPLAEFLDLRTMIVATCVVYGTCTMLMALLWRQNRRHFDGLGLLAINYLLQTVGLTALVMRGLIPESYSVVVSNLFLAGGIILGYRGYTLFIGKPQRLAMWAVMLTLFMLAQCYWFFIEPSLMWRKINSSMMMVVVGTLIIYVLSVTADPVMRKFTRLVAWSHLLYVAYFGLRIIIAWREARHDGLYFDVTTYESVLAMGYPALFVIMTYTVGLMINARLSWEAESALRAREEEHSTVKVLSGLLPICASCKKVRDDGGYWNQIEAFIKTHSEADFSHGLCPECEKVLYAKYLEPKPDDNA